MTIDAAQFIIDFPEFANTSVFPTSGITFWLKTAYMMLPACRWGEALDIGAELFTAHNIVIEAAASRSVATGNLPGIQTGAVSGKSVDRVSVSYDAQAGLEMDAGHWNLTVYGTRFVRYSRMAGSGGIQVTGAFIGGLGGGPFEGW